MITPPFGREGRRILLAPIFRSKRDLVEQGRIGDTAEFDNGHDKHKYEITEADTDGNKAVQHEKNGEPVE